MQALHRPPQHLPDRLAEYERRAGIVWGGGFVDQDEVARIISEQPRRGIDQERRTADDDQIGRSNRRLRLIDDAHIQRLLV